MNSDRGRIWESELQCEMAERYPEGMFYTKMRILASLLAHTGQSMDGQAPWPPQNTKHLRTEPTRERALSQSGLGSPHQRAQRSLQVPVVRSEDVTWDYSLGRENTKTKPDAQVK